MKFPIYIYRRTLKIPITLLSIKSMKKKLLALCFVSAALLAGCKTQTHTSTLPEFLSIDASGPAFEKSNTVAGTSLFLSSECASNRVGVVTLVSVKMICEPVMDENKPLKAPFNPSDIKNACGNIPAVYFRTGEPVRFMLVRTSDSVSTKDFLENTLKIEKEDIEGATLMIIQDVQQPKYVVTCDRNAAVVFQRTSTIPEGKFKTDALKVAERIEQYMATQKLPQ